MKNVTKLYLSMVILSVSNLALAHTQGGSLGSSSSGSAATDKYVVSCYDDGGGKPAKIWLHVKDLAPVLPSVVSIQAGNSATSSDPVDGDASYSVGVVATGSSATLSVNKSASSVKGIETYIAEFHCQSSNGTHTGTDWRMTLNQ